jgi:hypothetical protein
MSNHPSNDQAEIRTGDDKASPRHLYIVVDCKTKNCATAHVLTYLGQKGKTPTSVEYWMSYPLDRLPNLRKELRLLRFRGRVSAKGAPSGSPIQIPRQTGCTGGDEERVVCLTSPSIAPGDSSRATFLRRHLLPAFVPKCSNGGIETSRTIRWTHDDMRDGDRVQTELEIRHHELLLIENNLRRSHVSETVFVTLSQACLPRCLQSTRSRSR